MYATTFTDRELRYTPGEASAAGNPVIGNGHVFVHMDTQSPAMCSTAATRVGNETTFNFLDVQKEGGTPLPEVSSRSLHLSNGTYRSVAGTPEPECEVSVCSIRQSLPSVLQTVWVRDAMLMVHTVQPPPGMSVTRADLVIKNVGGHPLPHLAVEGTVGSVHTAYCCIYAGDSLSLDGVREPTQHSSAIHSLVNIQSPNTTLYMMHAVLHGDAVTAAHAFDICAQHFRTNVAPSVSMASVKSLHSLRWAALWRGGLTVERTADASEEEIEQIRVLNIHLQTSLYRLYSDYPDPNAVPTTYDVDPARFSRRPYALVDFLAVAAVAPWLKFMQNLKAPSPRTPMFEVAGDVVDAWDGYRTTLDRTQLDVHFQTLRRHAHELTIRVQNTAPPVGAGSEASIGTVKTRSGAYVSDDAFTTGMVRRAFESVEQICYALRLPADPAWKDLRNKLVVPRSSPFTTEIADVNPPAANQDGLVLLHPGHLRTQANTSDLGTLSTLIDGNTEAMIAAAQGAACPAAFASIAALASHAASLPNVGDRASRMDECMGWLMLQASMALDPDWGAAALDSTETASDIVACMVFGFLRARIQGHVTSMGVYTVPANLLPGPSTAILPRAWRLVRRKMTQGMNSQSEHIVQNTRAWL